MTMNYSDYAVKFFAFWDYEELVSEAETWLLPQIPYVTTSGPQNAALCFCARDMKYFIITPSNSGHPYNITFRSDIHEWADQSIVSENFRPYHYLDHLVSSSLTRRFKFETTGLTIASSPLIASYGPAWDLERIKEASKAEVFDDMDVLLKTAYGVPYPILHLINDIFHGGVSYLDYMTDTTTHNQWEAEFNHSTHRTFGLLQQEMTRRYLAVAEEAFEDKFNAGANGVRLHGGAVGELVQIDTSFGQEIPDNLWPCDGSVIDNPKAHVMLRGKNVKDLRQKVIAVADNTSALHRHGIMKGVEWIQLGRGHMPSDLGLKVADFSFTPSGSVTVTDYEGTRGTKDKSATGADNRYTFVIDKPPSDAFESGQGIGGNTHIYPRIFTDSGHWLSNLKHNHVVDLSHGHDVSFSGSKITLRDIPVTYEKGMTQTKLDLRQPTFYCDTFMVIY